MKKREFIVLSLTTLITACTASNVARQDEQKVTLTVSVAASVQDAMEDIKTLYQEKTPNINIVYNFGSSGSLQQQIEQGAPADIFLSAAPKQMNALQKKDLLLTGTRQDLLKNQVVLVTAKNTDKVTSFEDLNKPELKKIALGEPKSVPAGQYGKEVLTSLKLYDKINPKLVLGKDVRQVLFYVETGNVDAGLVYGTDAKISDKVTIVATAPDDSHSPIIYPIAVLKDSKNPEQSQAFKQFLVSDDAQKIFENYGFSRIKD